ncbi:MAG: hypothetical protein JXB26_06280 [Candidatus Aminicenantes bacterium]|nr:hypothetical protein [Candidatus Aminicenantes bacterium]
MNKLSKQNSHLGYILVVSFLIVSTPSFSQNISTSSDIFSLCKCSRCSSWLFEINNPLPHTDLPYHAEKNRTTESHKLQSVPMDHLSRAALVNFSEGQMHLDIPMVSFQPNPLGGKTIDWNINLLNVEF